MMDLEFMRPHMRESEPEYFDKFVAFSQRLADKHRTDFFPDNLAMEKFIYDGIEFARKTDQRRLEVLRKADRELTALGVEGLLDCRIKAADHSHKKLHRPRRSIEALHIQSLILCIAQIFTAAAPGRKLSASERAVFPLYAHAIYTEIFGAKWNSEKELRNGPWIDAIRKYLKPSG